MNILEVAGSSWEKIEYEGIVLLRSVWDCDLLQAENGAVVDKSKVRRLETMGGAFAKDSIFGSVTAMGNINLQNVVVMNDINCHGLGKLHFSRVKVLGKCIAPPKDLEIIDSRIKMLVIRHFQTHKELNVQDIVISGDSHVSRLIFERGPGRVFLEGKASVLSVENGEIVKERVGKVEV